jgi:hypothetical protein
MLRDLLELNCYVYQLMLLKSEMNRLKTGESEEYLAVSVACTASWSDLAAARLDARPPVAAASACSASCCSPGPLDCFPPALPQSLGA